MRIGVSSSCLYPMRLEESVQTLLNQGVKTLELFVNAASELTEPFLREIRRMTDDAGAEIASVHPFSSAFESMLFFSDYERRYEDGLNFYRQFFRAAELLHARIFVFHGCITRSPFGGMTPDEYCSRFETLRRAAAEYGVTFAQENVNGYLGESPEFIRAVRARLPDVRFVLDQKQCIRAGTSVSEMADAMKGRVCHVHLSDSLSGLDCLPPGKGDCDFAALFRLLKETQPEAQTGVIELYRKNFGETCELSHALGYLQKIQNDVKRG